MKFIQFCKVYDSNKGNDIIPFIKKYDFFLKASDFSTKVVKNSIEFNRESIYLRKRTWWGYGGLSILRKGILKITKQNTKLKVCWKI